jgi:hypothetical protein
MNIDALIAALGGRYDAAEIQVLERVLREYGGTVPDEQLISEAALALAIYRRGNRHRGSRVMEFWEIIENLYAQTGAIADAPPPTPGREYRIVDVLGPVPGDESWVAGDSDFADYIERIPLGPVLVTLRSTSTAVATAYVNGREVGWAGPSLKSGSFPHQINFLIRLDKAGILPRFRGIHRLTSATERGDTGSHIINFGFPRGQHLHEIKRRITG